MDLEPPLEDVDSVDVDEELGVAAVVSSDPDEKEIDLSASTDNTSKW